MTPIYFDQQSDNQKLLDFFITAVKIWRETRLAMRRDLDGLDIVAAMSDLDS